MRPRIQTQRRREHRGTRRENLKYRKRSLSSLRFPLRSLRLRVEHSASPPTLTPHPPRRLPNEIHLKKNRAPRSRRCARPPLARTHGARRSHRDPLRTTPPHGLHVHANGVCPEHWTPKGDGEDYELTPHLKPLEDLKNDFLLLENLWNAKTARPQWPLAQSARLALRRLRRTHLRRRSRLGRHLRRSVRRPAHRRSHHAASLELGLEATRTGIDTAGGGFRPHVWILHLLARPAHPVPQGDRPAARLRPSSFRSSKAPVTSSLNPDDPALITSLQRDDTSVLDLVRDQAKDLRKNGSSSDRVRLDEYFESVRSVEQRLHAAMRPQKRWINQASSPSSRPPAPAFPQPAPSTSG